MSDWQKPALGSPKMYFVGARAAGAGTGNQNIPCVDMTSNRPFKPRMAHLLLVVNGANSGGTGDGGLVDGNNVVNTGYTMYNNGLGAMIGATNVIGAIFDGVGARWLVALANSGVMTTLRLAWTQFNGGLNCDFWLFIWGEY